MNDIERSAGRIDRAVAGKSFSDYDEDEMLTAVVERNLLIIGEALAQASKYFPEVRDELSDLQEIVAFRNVLAHGYFSITNEVVWSAVCDDLPRLLEEVRKLKAKRSDA